MTDHSALPHVLARAAAAGLRAFDLVLQSIVVSEASMTVRKQARRQRIDAATTQVLAERARFAASLDRDLRKLTSRHR